MNLRRFRPLLWPTIFTIVVIGIFFELFFSGYIAVPADTLVGAYFPWLDYKWGHAVGVPVKNALLSDVFSQFFVFKYLVSDLIKQGVLPLWNKYSLSGTPLLAAYYTNPFFPANFLLLLPKFAGWNLFIFGSSLFAGLTMYLYLGFRIKSSVARFISSLVFAFFGPMTTWSEFGTAVWAASMIPLILLTLDLFILKKKTYALPLFSLLIAFLIFGGHVQLDTYVAAILPFYLIYLFIERNRGGWLPDLLKIITFGALGVGLSLVQLLPTIELQNLSIRGAENYASSFHFGLVEFPQLIRLWLADFFGHPSTQNQWGEYIYHEYSSFLGTLTVPLIISLFFSAHKNNYQKLFFWIFFVSLLLVTVNPLSLFLFSQPLPLLTYSSASRLFFVTGLSASILLAQALDHFIKGQLSRRTIALCAFTFLLLTIAALVSAPLANQAVAIRNSILPLVLLGSLLVSMLLPINKRFVMIFLVLVFVFEMGRYYRKYNPFVPANLVFPTTPAIEFVQKQPGIFRIAREHTNLLPPNTWAYYHLESVEGYEPLRLLNYSRLFHLLENGKYMNAASRYSELEDVSPKFLSALNVKYFFIVEKSRPSEIQQKLFDAGFKRVFTDKSVSVLENPDVSPRAYFVNSLFTVDTEAKLVQTLESETFDPTNSAVIIDGEGQSFHPTTTPVVTEHSDSRVIVTTSDPQDQFMILADTFFPGWRATLDGRSIPIYSTNGGLRGIYIPKGDHQVVMKYLPDSFTTGLRLTTIALLLLIVFTILIYGQRSSSKIQQS